LNGGFQKWIVEKRNTTNNETNIITSKYQSFEKKNLVKDKKSIDQNINEKNFQVIDARNKDRFNGKVPEPRKGLRSGNIKNSFCIPFNQCLNENKTFKSPKELRSVFDTCLENINEQNIVFSCGSGVTACVLALAYSLINDKYSPSIYDGSWAEYGLI
jgi:thiosulfate/3-mercaptopyruvate sulfurtransferase